MTVNFKEEWGVFERGVLIDGRLIELRRKNIGANLRGLKRDQGLNRRNTGGGGGAGECLVGLLAITLPIFALRLRYFTQRWISIKIQFSSNEIPIV